jgi:hypothetical protein
LRRRQIAEASQPSKIRDTDVSPQILNRKAFAAAAGALGIGVVEHETGGEIILHPVHRAADQVKHAGAVDEEQSAGRLDLFISGLAASM